MGGKKPGVCWPETKPGLLEDQYFRFPVHADTSFDHRAFYGRWNGRPNLFYVLPPFAAGKFISDTIMIVTGRYAAGDISDYFTATFHQRRSSCLPPGSNRGQRTLCRLALAFRREEVKFRWRILKGQRKDP
jgi:hypothetical protein